MPKSKKDLTQLYKQFSLHYSDSFRQAVEQAFIEPDDKNRPWIDNTILSDSTAKKNYGTNLRILRITRGLGLEALGKALNVSQTTIKDIEKGESKTDINTVYLKIFCLFFHVNPWYFINTPLPLPQKPEHWPLIDPMVFYDDEKERWIHTIIQNLTSDCENDVGNKLLTSFLKLSEEKNSTLRKQKMQDGTVKKKPDLFADIVDIFDRIPHIPNPDTFELNTYLNGYPIPLELSGDTISDQEFNEWENQKDQFFSVVDALSELYDRNPRLVRYLLCISTCDEPVKKMVYQLLSVGGFVDKV